MPNYISKKPILLMILLLVSARAHADGSSYLSCTASGSVDGLLSVEVSPTNEPGKLEVSTRTALTLESKVILSGQIDDQRILIRSATTVGDQLITEVDTWLDSSEGAYKITQTESVTMPDDGHYVSRKLPMEDHSVICSSVKKQ